MWEGVETLILIIWRTSTEGSVIFLGIPHRGHTEDEAAEAAGGDGFALLFEDHLFERDFSILEIQRLNNPNYWES